MTGTPTLTISEAARRLGLSRGTIYNRSQRTDAARIELTDDGRVPVAEIDRLLRTVEPAVMDDAAVLARLDEYLTRYAMRAHTAAIGAIIRAAKIVAEADMAYLWNEATEEELDAFNEDCKLLEHQIAGLWDALRFRPLVQQFRRAALDARINPPEDEAGAD